LTGHCLTVHCHQREEKEEDHFLDHFVFASEFINLLIFLFFFFVGFLTPFPSIQEREEKG